MTVLEFIMNPLVLTMIIICYLTGAAVTLSAFTTDETTIHKTGGLFGGPSMSSTHRTITPIDAWKTLIWPLFAIFHTIVAFLWLANELLTFPLILVGVKYKGSKMYRTIYNALDF
jgi:hypothetical protein